MSTNDTFAGEAFPPHNPMPGHAATFAPAEIAGIIPPLIGRDDELQRLIGALYAVIEGGPARLISVVGPAGIGKSRLAHEFRQVIARLPEPVTLYTLQADRQSAGQPYSLVRMLVAALFRIREGDAPGVARFRIESGVARLLGGESEEKAHLLGHLAGYQFADSEHLRGALAEPRQLRDRALHYAAQCIRAITAQSPLILVLDDFHYADESSIDAVAQVVGECGDASLLVLCLAQQRLYERSPGWDEAVGGAGERIDLGPLAERAGRRLVAEILRKAGKLPSDLRNLIVSRAEGNPYYVEELIKMLIADGVIVPGIAAWSVQQGRLSRLRIPPTLADLLRARIASLAATERDLLLRAAVVGRYFWADAAAQLGSPPTHGAEADPLLAGLEARELIAPLAESRFAGQREYAFRHELVHEVAYDQVPPEQRQSLHRAVAAWLVAQAGERSGAFASMIAEHLERAAAPVEAARWYVRAGQHARETYAVAAAAQHYQLALALLPPTGEFAAERIACFEGFGNARRAGARLADAADSFAQMAAIAAAIGDGPAEARAYNLRAETLDDAVDYQGSLESARRAIAVAEAAGDRTQLAVGMRHLAWAEMRFERAVEARDLCERALAIMEERGDAGGAALCKGLLGLLDELRGNYAGAIGLVEDALAYYRSAGHLTEATMQLNNLGYLANMKGDYQAALAYLQEGQALSRAIGSRVQEIYLLSNVGFTLNGLGAYAASEAESRRGIELSELSRISVFADFYCALAEALLGQGRPVEAMEAAQQALDIARRAEGPREVATAWRALGRAIAATGDPQGAPACFAESARLFEEIGARGELGRTLRAWAEHERRRGEPARGAELWAQARATFAAAGLTLEVARTPATPPAI